MARPTYLQMRGAGIAPKTKSGWVCSLTEVGYRYGSKIPNPYRIAIGTAYALGHKKYYGFAPSKVARHPANMDKGGKKSGGQGAHYYLDFTGPNGVKFSIRATLYHFDKPLSWVDLRGVVDLKKIPPSARITRSQARNILLQYCPAQVDQIWAKVP